MMDDDIVLLKNYIDSLTHDGKSIFGHDCRHYPPLFSENIGRGAYVRRFHGKDDDKKGWYADGLNLPDDYIIVNEELLSPCPTDKDDRVIDIGRHRVAIPLSWYFRTVLMAPRDQWTFINEKGFPIPDGIERHWDLGKALYTAVNLSIEDILLRLFHDVKIEDFLEINQKYASYSKKKDAIEQKKQFCLINIGRLRKEKPKEWDAYYDRLYMIYTESDQYGIVPFDVFCTELFKYVKGSLEAFWKIWDKGSIAWKIAQETRKLVSLNLKLRNARKNLSTSEWKCKSGNT